ncbi:hypothetical protein H5J25_03430 [Sphingomonas aliaeris]|jgi:hypothetical protein|uniref:Uncharacterized protein n=1 Tax=Sphingomonas aliaeris TaxID=2759526 RepID=A0A974NVR3_9SPHN|nr:hypothetical protein [Sphingomonas aliaeris]QQV77826.1 hypothetical protein H5J25_03430 [Sphingomonas aliaeris]
MDEMTVMTCVAHIRAAAKLCEDAGMLACWANLLGVADQLLESADIAATVGTDLRRDI